MRSDLVKGKVFGQKFWFAHNSVHKSLPVFSNPDNIRGSIEFQVLDLKLVTPGTQGAESIIFIMSGA